MAFDGVWVFKDRIKHTNRSLKKEEFFGVFHLTPACPFF